MTVARGAALGALLLVVAVVVIVLLGGGGGQQYKLVFETAGQLVRGNDVQIGGRRVGGVDDIKLTDNNQAEVTITVEEPYAPLHEGTTATIRLSSLSSVANRYIALSPGANSNPELKADATLPTTDTTSVVDIDQLFNTFDDRTRRGLVDVIQGSATQYAGKEREVSQAAKYFSPALSTTSRLVQELTRDQRNLEGALVSGARVVVAVGEKREQLSTLISSLNVMMGAIARENGNLAATLDEAPGTLREASSTFRDLRSALDDLDPLVEASYPATRDLDRFFREFRPLVNEAVPTFEDLSTFVSTPGPDNDATDLVKMLPQLQQVGSPAFKNSVSAMRAGQPVVDFFRPYSPELIGWLNSFGQASANYDATGHYARAMANFGAFSYDASSNQLNPVSPDQRLAGLRGTATRRCPGGASQARPDGSNPWQAPGGDCDPSNTLQGP
ncbi:MlaD family protein [Conexibacter sp. JD483]|uniref:MlaD family protein n=1 Tax=unclassified Conexibacter TaxID=2627773 RepID=UPI00271C0212|nr:MULTISPECIES: MlaD family protein [unclassified Conexibacter]MDO8186151.1 MlaD family protein [Conexibacter sp. CPCC 205706]MDO8199641.1 MlaD family protein [Conexibacter sp. CPCC 205762]MDR9369105.1 MlaD family protein [Conexibacter sp. JD483]